MSILLVVSISAVVLLAIFVMFFILQNSLKKHIREETRASLESAKSVFEIEQGKSTAELDLRKQAVESSVQGLKEELEKYKQIMRDFEQDRTRKYGNLENELKNASLATTKLQDTTNRLTNILGNVKLRGQWGERMAEDIIRYAGLIEGVNYLKQKQLDLSTSKPDFTFLLPDNHKVNMDVKFPLDNYIHMVNAEVLTEKERFQKEFEKNVKERIKEIQNRNYINPAENTLDFVLLFIPNEQVYGLIQENIPDLMDLSLKQKVVLCSPFTLYAMLSVVRQAYENFRFEKDMKKIIGHMEQFHKHYERFKGRFDDIGDTIVKLDQKYSDVKDKSFKQLDTKIRHIEDLKKGKSFLKEIECSQIDIPQEISSDA